MLGYEWTTTHTSSPPPQLMLSDVVDHLHQGHHTHNHDHNNHTQYHNHQMPMTSSSSTNHHHNQRPMFEDHFNSNYTFQHDHTPQIQHQHNNTHQIPLFSHDPRAFQSGSYPTPSMLTLDSLSGPTGFNSVVPKQEPDHANRPIGLNLGGRTYFSPDDDLVSRLYRRSRPPEAAVNSPRCQAEGCNADLSNAKHYHRRHKVCEFHSKASTVIAAGLTQRFCQQCSRFHLLAEFDNGKRSCRKRLADHNRRRRKSSQLATTQDHRMACSSSLSSENARTSPSQRSPTSDSGMNSSSSVTIAVSPPRASFDSQFRPRLYE